MYCDLAGPSLESAFHPCYLRCESNRSNRSHFSAGGGQPSYRFLHHSGCVNSCLDMIFCFIILLLEGSLESHKSSLTIFRSTCHDVRGGLCFVSLGALLLVLTGGVLTKACEIKLVPWY